MKRASLTEAKNNLSALIDRVRHGETVVILDRGRPVARIESILESEIDPKGRVDRLERAGVIRRPSRRLSARFLDTKPPRMRPGHSAVDALLEERRRGR